MCYEASPQLRRTLWTGRLLAALREMEVLEWSDVVRHAGPDVALWSRNSIPRFLKQNSQTRNTECVNTHYEVRILSVSSSFVTISDNI
jgi:hypothetical protein